jgi:NAD(P)-dependent dehydrogenase (short-subunit alcohol dehydrogenase family)
VLMMHFVHADGVVSRPLAVVQAVAEGKSSVVKRSSDGQGNDLNIELARSAIILAFCTGWQPLDTRRQLRAGFCQDRLNSMAKVVLITGCSAGIGRLTAELFAARGWSVAATARRPEEISLPNVAALRLDVTDEASIAAAVASTVDRFGTIDVLVNNAGYGLFGPLEGATPAEFEAQIRTNLLGPVAVICRVLPLMRARGSGVIVNVSSLAGRMTTPFMAGYHASKFALEGLSESLRYELSLHGVRVKLVEPAHFKTGFIARSLKRTSHPAYDAQFENFMGWVRKEDARAPEPGPVAKAIYLAAKDPSQRLRYPVGGRLIRALVTLFPDFVWRSLNEQGMKRPVR